MMLNLPFLNITSQSSKILMNFEPNNWIIKYLRLYAISKVYFRQKLQFIFLMTSLLILFSDSLDDFDCVLSLVSLIFGQPDSTWLSGRKLFQKSEVRKFLMPQLFFLIVVNVGLGRFAVVHFNRRIFCFFTAIVPWIIEHFF